MIDRDELADVLMRADPLYPAVMARTLYENMADAILSRWRLVPVEETRHTRVMVWVRNQEPTNICNACGADWPCETAAEEQHRAADELTPAGRIRGYYASAAARDVDTVLTREPGMIVMVGDDYWAWTGKAWAQVMPRTDQRGPHED